MTLFTFTNMANTMEEQQSGGPHFKIEETWPPRRDKPGEKAQDPLAFQKWMKHTREMYDSGRPLFPRDSILDIARQLESDPMPAMITVRHWDGAVDELPIMVHDRDT
jgi:hypothetical protein